MRTKITLTIAFLGVFLTVFSQPNPTWEKWNWLIGDWAGEGSDQPGKGGGTFTFKADLDQKILVRKSHSEYPALGSKPEITHNDLLIVYPDHSGNGSKAIYFDNEGHIINYSITFSDQSIILTSEKIPNVPLFRLTYTLLEDQKVNTKFEISRDGANFNTYLEGNSIKIRNEKP